MFMIEEESAATNIKILTMLVWFSTRREGRAELLRWGILNIILPLQKHENPVMRLVAHKLIFNLIWKGETTTEGGGDWARGRKSLQVVSTFDCKKGDREKDTVILESKLSFKSHLLQQL